MVGQHDGPVGHIDHRLIDMGRIPKGLADAGLVYGGRTDNGERGAVAVDIFQRLWTVDDPFSRLDLARHRNRLDQRIARQLDRHS